MLNLRGAAATLRLHGVALLIASRNKADDAGHFLRGPASALEVIRDVASDHLFLHCDADDLDQTNTMLTAPLPLLRHVDLSGAEGGDDRLLAALDGIAYPDWISCGGAPVPAPALFIPC